MKITETKQGAVLKVYVKPRARRFELKVEDDDLTAYCTEEPTRGRVNKELTKELSRLFGRNAELVSGFTSRQKLLLIKGASKAEVEQVLTGL